jgi:S-layer homology domain.
VSKKNYFWRLLVFAILVIALAGSAFASNEGTNITAYPGANINTYCGFEVELDGSGSEGGNGRDITSCFWRFVSKPEGSTAVISNAADVKTTFVPDVLGEYLIGLIVSDGVSASKEETIIVRAKALDSNIDDIDLKSISGPLHLEYSFKNTIPLSDGWIITADNSSKVLIVNVLTGQVGKSFQLNATPNDMVIDFDRGLLLVTMNTSSKLAKINIYDETISYISLPYQASTIENADSGRVFVRLVHDSSAWYGAKPCVVDYVSDTIIFSTGTEIYHIDGFSYGDLYAFNAKYNYLFIGNTGTSPSTLWKYSYDPRTGALSLVKESEHGSFGSNGQDLKLSPDGEHLVFCNSSGNGQGYTIFDINPHDFNQRYGEFDCSPYPHSGCFSQDNKYFVARNHDSIKLFDVNTHALISTINRQSAESYNDKVYFSRGGKLIYYFNGSIGYMYKTYIDDGTPVDADYIDILGENIGFNKSTLSYTIIMPPWMQEVPKINVSANEMFDVKIDYPRSIPGEATVSIGAGGMIKKTYSIYLCKAPEFVDIDGHWAEDVIIQVSAIGLFNGVSETQFEPQGSLTRGMFVTLLSRLEGIDPSYAYTDFNDVDASAYYASAVRWASYMGIVNGTGEGKFSPDGPITRQDAATMLGRYFSVMGIELPLINNSNVFADDVHIAGYAKDMVYKMQSAGIINGKGNNMFDPLGLTTRAEAATLFMKLLI